MSSKFAGSDGEQVQFVEDFEELANLEEFLEYRSSILSSVQSIRLVMVCLLWWGGENSGVQTRRMLKPDLDSESV